MVSLLCELSSLSRDLRCVDFGALGEHFAWYALKHKWNQSRCNGTLERVMSRTRNLYLHLRQVQCLLSGLGSMRCGFFRPDWGTDSSTIYSEDLDVVSAYKRDTEDSPPQSHAYKELVEVVTRAVEKCNIDWPAEKEDVRSKGKLDKRFLPSRTQPQLRGLTLISMPRCRDRGRNRFHVEFFCTQASHYSSITNKNEHGYGEMPKVEETLASYLSPKSSLSIKSLVFPTKPVRTTSALVGKAYSAAGQAAACLHTMSLRQAYQGELLADLDEGGGIGLCSLSSTTSHCPAVAGQSMVSRYNIPPRRASSGAPRQEGPSVPSRELDISPHPELRRLWAWPEGAQLISGLSTEVVAGLSPPTLKV